MGQERGLRRSHTAARREAAWLRILPLAPSCQCRAAHHAPDLRLEALAVVARDDDDRACEIDTAQDLSSAPSRRTSSRRFSRFAGIGTRPGCVLLGRVDHPRHSRPLGQRSPPRRHGSTRRQGTRKSSGTRCRATTSSAERDRTNDAHCPGHRCAGPQELPVTTHRQADGGAPGIPRPALHPSEVLRGPNSPGKVMSSSLTPRFVWTRLPSIQYQYR